MLIVAPLSSLVGGRSVYGGEISPGSLPVTALQNFADFSLSVEFIIRYLTLPIGVIHFSFGGFGRIDSEIIFPMAKDVCIVIDVADYAQESGIVTQVAMEIINRMVASRPNLQYLISSQKSLVEKYSKYLRSYSQTKE